MIRIIIVDDESSARTALRSILNQYFPEASIVGEASTPMSAKKLIESRDPQLVFLDVEMQTGTGFDVLESLTVINFQIVFVTAHKQEAYMSFRYSALDYLIKPVRIEDLKRAFEKYKRNELLEKNQSTITASPDKNQNPFNEGQLVVPEMNGFSVVVIQDIIRCEGSRNYTFLYMKTGKKLTATKTLMEFENLLAGHGFIRIHRSHLINLGHITKYTKGKNSEIELSDGIVIPIARERRPEFLKYFLTFESLHLP